MKIRHGFVSNSSSSSFICAICGDLVEGWNSSYDRDLTCYDCGHEVCGDHPRREATIQEMKDFIAKEGETCEEDEIVECFQELLDDEYEEPAFLCPLCNLDAIPDFLFMNYLLKIFKINEDSMRKEIKARFGNMDALKSFLGK